MKYMDFTIATEIAPEYLGSEKKKTMTLNNKKYLVKFPDPNRSTKLDISYINNVYSEYIGTKIFESIGFKVQKVFLGKYKTSDKEKIVCACEDFTNKDTKLVEFEKFENASVEPNPFKRELKDIFHIIDTNVYNIDKKEFKEKFWDMFIVDALIGNKDRHNGNFGFLKNIDTEELTFAPIYDCGSCLYSTLTDEDIAEYLKDKNKMRDCIKNTSSAIKEDGAKIKYNTFIGSLKNEDCNKALIRIYPLIDMRKIEQIIDEIDCISEKRRIFYKEIIKGKYNEILTPAYKKINKLNQIS